MPDYQSWVSDPAFLVVVSGPSGVGKSTLCESVRMADSRVCYSISATTRPPRAEERNGADYFFVTAEEFARMREAGELAEWAEVHGAWYGTPRRYLDEQMAAGRTVIMDLDVQGGLSLKRAYPDAVLIFVLPPSLDVLERRLKGRRSDRDDVVARRIAAAPVEIGHASSYEYVVVNGEFETAAARVRSIVAAERSRRERCYHPAPADPR